MTALLGPITDIIAFKLTWLTLVLGRQSTLWLAIIMVLASLALNQGWRKQWRACLLVAVAGAAMDQALVMAGVFQFPGPWIPVWLVLLWLSFATVLASGFHFLQAFTLPLQMLVGGCCPMIAYGAAMQLGAVVFLPPTWQVFMVLALLWTGFLPMCLYLLRQPVNLKTLATLSCLAISVLSMRPLPVLANPDYTMLGSATFRVFWWNLYDATLYTQSAEFSFPETRPYLFSLKYQRDVSREQLVKETLKQWDAQLVQVSGHWQSNLESLLPDVHKGDELSMEVATDLTALLRHNGQRLGTLDDPELVLAFAGIWLAETTTHPDFRQQLLGKTP